MKLNRISIKNVLGLEHLETEVGSALTIIEGGNGTGKTSVLEALRAALGGGHDATLLRNGTNRGDVVLVFDEVSAEKTITSERSSVAVKLPNGGKLSQPQNYLDKLNDVLALNPVTFLTASPKDRTRYLLETVPVGLTVEEITRATGVTFTPGPGMDTKNGFEVIAALQKQFQAEESAVKRVIKEKEISIKQLEQALPPDTAGEDLSTLRAEQSSLEADLIAKRDEINAEAFAAASKVKTALQERLDHINRQIAAVRAAAAAELSTIEREASSKIQRIKDESSTLRADLASRVARAEEIASQQKRSEGVRQTLTTLRESIDGFQGELARHKCALEGLALLRSDLMKRIPIPGLEIVDGDIFFKTIPFDRLNQAQRVKLALKLAQIRSGNQSLGLVLVDGFECLDSDTWKAFCEIAPRTGLQLIITRVTEGPLKITRVNSQEEAA